MNIIKEWQLSFPDSSANNTYTLSMYGKVKDLTIIVDGPQTIQLSSDDLSLALINAKDFTICEGGKYTSDPGIYYGSVGGLKEITITVNPETIESTGTITVRSLGD